jgi:UDP-N-acetylmuramoyl-tripeptide--D-alanyl-D-alanine ligase
VSDTTGRPTLTVQDVVRATHGALVGGDLGISVQGVSIDSRTLGVGEAFFAIRGHRLDGHDFVGDAIARGAACVVVHTLPDDLPAHVAVVLVEDTTRALGRLAHWHRQRFSLPVVGVTGSNGKTTTKEMIASVLGTRRRVLKSEGSLNNQWGLPMTLMALGPEHEAAVLEMGTNQPGDIAYLVAIAAPTLAVVTSIALAHTEALGSLDGIVAEKSGLVRAIPAAGRVVLNADDPRVLGMAAAATAPVLTYGRAPSAAVRAVGPVGEAADGIAFTLAVGGAEHPVRLAFAGAHNVSNALAAAAVGHALGLALPDIARGLAEARPVKGRGIWREAGGVRILDDTYNANPVSVRAALDTLRAASRGRRALVAFGDMLELGETAVEAHREIGRAIAAAGVGELIGVGRLAAEAVDAAREAGLAAALHTTTFEDTVAHLVKRVAPGDVLLVKGSRGMRMERVVDALIARLRRE